MDHNETRGGGNFYSRRKEVLKSLKKYKGYLVDLDGTMYRGNERIEAAAEFIEEINAQHIPYLFLTNNSTSTQSEVAEKLNQMDIKATADHVFTSSLATAKYIKEKQEQARCFVIGERGLSDALADEGHVLIDSEEKCDFVVMGLDRQITYEKLATACLAIRNGATFISTNGDAAIPTERGFLPGNGSLTSVVHVSTGKQPIFIGKPEAIIMDQALHTLGVNKADTIMVGDNYDTDILAGIRAQIDTLLVFTGVTSYEEYIQIKKKPTHHVQKLSEWILNGS